MRLRRRLAVTAVLTICALSGLGARALAELPDNRGYEMISPVAKNGVSPYAAVPSLSGQVVNFQARGAFSGATSGSVNLYQAIRTGGNWQTASLTPTPTEPIGPLEEQAPVWFSPDLSQTIFTTPTSYATGDADMGALSLYKKDAAGDLTWVSRGTQGSGEAKQSTFDSATPDGNHVAFSSAESLLPAAAGLSQDVFPEAEYLYERDLSNSQTNLLSLNGAGQPVGAAISTFAADYTVGNAGFVLANTEGFFPGQTITVGAGESAEVTQINAIRLLAGVTYVDVAGGTGLKSARLVGTPVSHLAEGAVLGNGAHLTTGTPPAGEYLPANSGSGSTTNALSSDALKVFFEAPSPAGPEPVGLYMRRGSSTPVKIAGAAPDGSEPSGFGQEVVTFGSAHFEGAAANGSLMFFTSEEGLAGASKGKELYEYNTTEREIGGVPPMTVSPLSTGLHGDDAPVTVLTVTSRFPEETITVASTADFTAGETIEFGRFSINGGEAHNSNLTSTIASVKSGTELVLTGAIFGGGNTGVPAGTEVHGVHTASLIAVSNDGSHVYFVSDGVLASNANARSAVATPVKPNLYVFDTVTGTTTFIGTAARSDVMTVEGSPTGLAGEPDISRPAIPAPEGGVLVFASAANLTGRNPWQEYTEIYRYTVAGNKLECLSCTAPGVKPTGNATFGETAGGTYDPPGLSSPMSEDGRRVFFDTPDSLVPEDTNGGAPQSAKFGTPTSTDVYEAEGGKVYLISSGKATTPTVLQGTTPSGNDVLFTTTAKLAPGDTDGGYENVWDARVGGGFPAEAGGGQQPSCVGDSCRAAFGVTPVFAPPASTTPQSAGSPPLSTRSVRLKPPVCRKGLVKKRVKGKIVCTKKSTGKVGRASRKAGRAARTRG